VDVREIARSFGQTAVEQCEPRVSELIDQRLLERAGNRLRLTPRGRLLSNEVFQAFLTSTEVPARPL
jgi:oxygen-independent coproporphyrinogen-3 oxidase